MDTFSKNQLAVKETWISSLRLYRKVMPKIWYLGVMAGTTTTVSVLLNILFRTNGISSKIISITAPLVISLATLYLTSLMLYKIYNIGNNNIVTLKDSFVYINKRFIKVTICVFILYLSYSLGIIALIIPGIFVFVLLSMVQPLALIDSQGIIESLKNSSKLVWGNWWRTFAVVFPLLFVNYWISTLISRAFVSKEWYLIGINGLIAMLFSPLFYVCILVVFNDLKLRKNNKPNVIATAA